MRDPTAQRHESAFGSAHVADGQLAKLACRGDREAFDQLMQRHQAPVYRLCRALVMDGTDAEDAVQETFVRAFVGLARFDTGRTFGPWVRGIAAKVCLQVLRRRKRKGQRQVSLETRPMEPAAPEAPEASPLVDRALAALTELDDTYRLPLALFYLEDASVAEVAEALQISPGAARVRLHRGREKLRQILMTERVADDGDA